MTIVFPNPASDEDVSGLIDVGPFFDRFDHFAPGTKIGVLAHPDPVVQAIVKDVLSRKWVKLTLPEVSAAIGVLISKGVPGVDAELRSYIISAPVAPHENLALRKVYFS